MEEEDDDGPKGPFGGLFDEFGSWYKWKLYDTLFGIALFLVLKRFKLLVPTARLLQWL
jgi:hypothetical protein